ncbi:unnamed protein product [Merluccius merluccius]
MAELDLSLSDALSDSVAQPGQEARVERDFVAQLEAEAFDDQIGETVGKTDYIPLLDGDDTATDMGTALENGEKKAEGAQKPGKILTMLLKDTSILSLSLSLVNLTPGPLGSPTGPVQVVDSSLVGAFSGFMEGGVALLPAERPPSIAEPQQHSSMLPEPQAPRGPLNPPTGEASQHPIPQFFKLLPLYTQQGASQGDCWPDKAACLPADLPFTATVATVISRHASQLASSPDQPTPDCRPHRESGAYAGGDEKESEGSDRKQKKKKKRRPKDEGSWDHPEVQEAQEESPTTDGLYQRVGPRRDKAAGGAGEGGWEEQIGKSGGRGKRGKSRKKLPEEWAVMAEPFVPSASAAGSQVQAEMLVELGAAAPSLPVPEVPYLGMEHGLSARSQEFYPEEGLILDPLDQDLFSITASSVTQLAQNSGLKATAAPFSMPAASVPLGSFHPFSATHHEQGDVAVCDVVDNGLFDHGSVLMECYTTDTSAFSPSSEPCPDQSRKMETSALPLSPSDSSWLLGDSSDSFNLGDLPATLGCPLPGGLVLDATGPAPLRSPRTTAQDCHTQPRECQDAMSSRKHRSPSSSSSSSLKSPTFNIPPQDSPVLTPPASSPLSATSLASYLNPAAKPFFPSLNEPMEAADEKKMEDNVEWLDESVNLDKEEQKSEKSEKFEKATNVDKQEEEKQNKPETINEKELKKKSEPAKEKETEKEKQTEKVGSPVKVASGKMEDGVEQTPDKSQLVDMRAKVVENVEKAVKDKTEKMIKVSKADEDQETIIIEETKPVEKSKVQVPAVSIVDKVEKTDDEEVADKLHEKVEPERQEEEKPVIKEEVKKMAEKKEVKKEEKEKSGKIDTVTKKPAAKPSTGSLALGKDPSSPEKKTKSSTGATKLITATKVRPSSAATAPTRRPAPSSTTTSTNISATLAKKTPAAKPTSAPAAGPKRPSTISTSRPSSSVTSSSTTTRDVKPKTTTTTEKRALVPKVTTVPAARFTAGTTPTRNGSTTMATSKTTTTATSKTATTATSKTSTAARMTTPSRPALSTPRTSSTSTAAGVARTRTVATKSALLSSSTGTTTTTEKKPLVPRAPRTTTPSTTTATRTTTSNSSRPTSRPGTASTPDIKNVRSKIGSTDNMKHQPGGGKVSSASQNRGATSKDPSQGKVHIVSKKLDFSHITSRLGSKDNIKHVPGGGNVQIINKKVDLSKVTSKCGSKDNIKHKPGGGDVKIESHKVNFKDKAQSKVGSMDNLGGSPGKGEENQETAEEGIEAPVVSADKCQAPDQGLPGHPTAQENGLKEGGTCRTDGLCDASGLETRIPETRKRPVPCLGTGVRVLECSVD